MSGALTILTGPAGSGKTTLCRGLAVAARRTGLDVAGVLSPARFVEARKVGIEAVDLRSGETRPLAWLHDPARPTRLELGSWSFDEAVLAWGNALLQRAAPCELLVVDELGPLELIQSRGWTAGLGAIDSGGYRRALVVVRSGLLARARARWPRAAVTEAGDADARRRIEALLADAGAEGRDPR